MQISPEPVSLTPGQRRELAEKTVTCPFMGSAVSEGALLVLNTMADPLASVKDVLTLGNSGGGDLGDLLILFAKTRHVLMGGTDGSLSLRVPMDLFSLEFPGSQGAHPGHSGILMGDPRRRETGAWNEINFERLKAHQSDGFLKRSSVGKFIAENLDRDDQSKVIDTDVLLAIARDAVELTVAAGSAAVSRIFGFPTSSDAATFAAEDKFTALLDESNLIGSAGEFSLLFAFLHNSPKTDQNMDGEIALSMVDVERMFREKRLPDNWHSWRKTRSDAVAHMAALVTAAVAELVRLKIVD